jgi:tRNA wybutosine-synthesizing protein 1
VDRLSLQRIRFAVCGLGDSEYGEEFNAASADIDKWFGQLGASRIYPLGSCDKSADQQAQFNSWISGFISELQDSHSLEFHPSNIAYDSDDEEEEADDGELNKDIGAGDDNLSGDEMVDVEDMGKMASKIRAAKVNRAEEEEAYDNGKGRAKRSIGNTAEPAAAPAPRDMVSPMLHKNLTKQGYKIVGSHSGVKICRWTKAALRGRGQYLTFLCKRDMPLTHQDVSLMSSIRFLL